MKSYKASYKTLLTSVICIIIAISTANALPNKVDNEFASFWMQLQTAIKHKDKNEFIKMTEEKIYYLDAMMDDYVEIKDRTKVFDDKALKTIFSFSDEFLKTDANSVMSKKLNGNQGFRNILKKKFKNKIVYRCSVGTNSSGIDIWFVKINNEYKIFAVSFDEGE